MTIRHLATLAGMIAGLMLPVSLQAQDYDARAREIVSKMTLTEKISQLHGTWSDTAKRIVVGVPRLGIPDLLVTNGPAGFGPAGPGHEGKATGLPAPISLAATWDLDAAREYGRIEAIEALAYGNTFFEAPDVNLARVPQSGRTFEAYGEDPFLVGKIAVANVEGIQGQGIIANVKHYVANDQEHNRLTVNAEVDERTLRELYLAPFEATVVEGHIGSVMASYNRVNGVYACQNDLLLNGILKDEWNFEGFVSSDFWAVHETLPALDGGLDLEMPDGKFFGEPLKQAIVSGSASVATVDEHLVRRFRTMMKFGVWDKLPERKKIPVEAHGAIARKLAQEGMVLLRNEKEMLPLKADSLKTVALVGPFAGKAKVGGAGSSQVDPFYKISPLEGLQKRLGQKIQVNLVDGKDIAKCVAAARSADVAIVMVGNHQGEGNDYPLRLGSGNDALVEAVAAANPRTVVVVKSGGPILMPWAEKVPAILEAWYPGEEDGNAVAGVLMGDVNPSGKLPITFPKSDQDVPAHTLEQYPGIGEKDHTVVSYSEGVFMGYRWLDAKGIEPLFPFGHGLSYTTFGYSGLKLSGTTLSTAAPTLTVEWEIKNTGTRNGSEVAQVYVGMPSVKGAEQPPRQLKGFARVDLEPGKSAKASVTLNARSFSFWDVNSHGWRVLPGSYVISVGASSRDIRLSGTVTTH